MTPNYCNGKAKGTNSATNPNNGAANNACGGGDNLMFWEIDNNSTGNLSAQQGQVVRSNPVVQ